jgi:hypothetical protein
VDKAMHIWMRSIACLLLLCLVVAPAGAQTSGRLTVAGNQFHLSMADGRQLASRDLVGAIFDVDDGRGGILSVRIDAVEQSSERPDLLLHRFSVEDKGSGAWRPLCDADAHGRRAGFPVAGRWRGTQHYLRAKAGWFLTCTSGAQGKCILWGYDPERRGPRGEDLAPYYQACTHMVRADYDGSGAAHTRNGTPIEMWDDAGIQTRDTPADPTLKFEAGWARDGAVCVARTRYADLLPLDSLLHANPRLGGACDESAARRRGALIFNRSR